MDTRYKIKNCRYLSLKESTGTIWEIIKIETDYLTSSKPHHLKNKIISNLKSHRKNKNKFKLIKCTKVNLKNFKSFMWIRCINW